MPSPVVRAEPVEVDAEATAITWRAGRAEEMGWRRVIRFRSQAAAKRRWR
jgi:hypothetical protein